LNVTVEAVDALKVPLAVKFPPMLRPPPVIVIPPPPELTKTSPATVSVPPLTVRVLVLIVRLAAAWAPVETMGLTDPPLPMMTGSLDVGACPQVQLPAVAQAVVVVLCQTHPARIVTSPEPEGAAAASELVATVKVPAE